MSIFAIADLHLAFSVPKKRMDVFGKKWVNYAEKIKTHWEERVSDDDLILIAGDISWAMRLSDALKDLEWIDALPGTKVMIRGNHDYWWASLAKMRKLLPPSIHVIHNTAFLWQDVAIAGSRLWDTNEFDFNDLIEFAPNSKTPPPPSAEDAKLFERELERLELSLKAMEPTAKHKMVMTHYPPIGNDLKESRVSALLEKWDVDLCVFGHLHNLKEKSASFGTKNGIHYILTACDYLDFAPLDLTPLMHQ